MSLNYLTVTLDLYDGQGNPEVRGSAAFVPSAVLTDAGAEVVSQDPVTAVFHAGGLPAVKLLATDSSGPLPTGWTWAVTFSGQAAPPAGFSFYLPAGPQTFTATNATPCVFTGSGAGYVNGTGVQLSGGSLPAGFTAGTTYYVVAASGATFELSATAGGSPIASTGTGSGSVIAVSTFLSVLIPVSSGTTYSAYMLLPTGTPSSGQVPIATGTGEGSAWGNVATNPMTTSGDTVYGGTGGALTRLAGDTSNTRKFLREQSSGGVAQPPAWDTLQAADVPTLNQNTTGIAANITDTLDQVPAPAANVSLNSHKITSLANGSSAQDAAAYGQTPAGGATVTIGEGGTGQTSAAAAYNALSPMTTTGDIEYESGAATAARLAGNTTSTKNFLTSTGSGGNATAPAWGTIAAADMPAGTTSAQGALQLDGTAGDIQPAGQSAAAGSKGQAADAKHIHPPGSAFLCTPSSYAPASQTLLTVGSTTMAVPGITTTVASGSNGGEISAVASWSSPSNGVLDVASTTGFASTGTLLVVASGPTVAVVTYTGTSGGNSFTGCAYSSGSASGTVATGGFVSQASASALVSTGSFTAPVSQDVLVTAVLATETSTSSTATAYGLAAHGTLTPLVAPIVNVKAPSAALVMMITLQFLVTGLTNGSTYNYDLLMCVASPSTASIAASGVTSTTPTLGNTGVSAPALMTVQAV